MRLFFTKMHGLGNDYIYMDGFDSRMSKPAAWSSEQKGRLAVVMSRRHTGIGADGLIFIQPSEEAVFRMEMYNADGSRGAMCGNGIRCAARYAYDHGISTNQSFQVQTDSGIKSVYIRKTDEGEHITSVQVDMGVMANLGEQRVLLKAKEERTDFTGGSFPVQYVSAGNRHCIFFVENVEAFPLKMTIGGKEVTIGGMCKGSGMIHPNMCTMLAFVTTDVNISKKLLQEALSADVQDTFNMVSVDGDTSTNDTLLVLANGQAENPEITEKGADYDTFVEALHYVNETLAKKIAGDGEGATALFEVKVIHADNKEDAKTLAKSVITSSLTKAALFGHDANWGRILCALGYSGAKFDPEAIELYLESSAGKILIFKDGMAADYSEEEATRILSCSEVTALVDMKMGEAEATAWGCDLTYDYVKINADYRS